METGFNSVITATLSTVKERYTAYAGNIRRPWQSVYGFPILAARLAAGQELLLSCREDEVFELMAGLNELLQHPASLNRAYRMLQELEQHQRQKLAGLIRLRDQPLDDSEITSLLAQVEQVLAEAPDQTTRDRLAGLLSPNHPVTEITGAQSMLNRLHKLLPALAEVKDRGFRVVVRDRQRQAARPTLAASRRQPILPAGFLAPVRYHLTLWDYLVVRGDSAQSTVWN
jgi:hypothetical protein